MTNPLSILQRKCIHVQGAGAVTGCADISYLTSWATKLCNYPLKRQPTDTHVVVSSIVATPASGIPPPHQMSTVKCNVEVVRPAKHDRRDFVTPRNGRYDSKNARFLKLATEPLPCVA